MKLYIRVFIQIFLLVSMSCAFSYMVHHTDNLVSAQEPDILLKCVEDIDEKICQSYPLSICDSVCKEDCISSAGEECKLGTCFDPVEGTCSENAPKYACEVNGGEWGEGNMIECEVGCCIIGSQVSFITERQCERIKELLGILTEFKPEVDSVLECLIETSPQVEGACVIYSGNEKICRFVTQSVCSGDFYERILCSHSDLEMDYEKMFTTGCVEGKDEVYWLDDHGNRENIYEGANSLQKDSSWNNGLVKSKNDSCILGDFNFGICGNCDVFTTSRKCGESTANEKLEVGDVVCRDISCWDSFNNKKRLNGENWCYYQGSVLPEKGSLGLNRSTIPPGSRQFEMICHEGVIYNSSCGDERGYVCRELQVEIGDGSSFSLADCIGNLAPLCLDYNTYDNKIEGMNLCENNVDCYIKQVRVPRSKFNFDVCVPKYPTGFDFTSSDPSILGNGQSVCSLATLTCNVARVKRADGTKKWINKGCIEGGFVEQMNDFCMSLGDCGGSVNYIGEYSDSGYSVFGSPPLTKFYIDSINYSETILGKYIEIVDIDDFLSSLKREEGAIGEGLENVNFPEDVTKSKWFKNLGKGLGSVAGLASTSLLLKAKTGPILGKVGTPIFGVVVGAVIGASVVTYLIKSLGLGPGISNDLAQALIATAAVGGGIVGGQLAGLSFLGALGPAGWIALIAAVVITIILWTANVGKVKTYTVSFQCRPWQPPVGGDNCDRCYDDGFGCSKYSCEALGTACEFLNEETSFEECVEIPDDNLGPPQISPWEEVVSEGFGYEEVGDNSFRVVSKKTDDGCMPASTLAIIGIQLDEPGRCTFAVESGIFDEEEILAGLEEGEYDPEDFGLNNDFLTSVGFEGLQPEPEELDGVMINTGMEEFYFGGNNIFLLNHTHPLYFPSLGRLGEAGWSPDRRIDFDMKIRCEDRHGNKNPADYIIRTCIRPEQDITAPYVLDKDPADGLVSNDAASVNFSVYTHEPCDCKWSLQDKDYELMENSFECDNNPKTDLKVRAGGSFECESNTEMTLDELSIYVRCKDQPWFSPENESDRNTMENSYNLTLVRTDALEIDSVILNNNKKLEFGVEPAVVNVEARTSGGGYNGEAECMYLAGNYYTPFSQTFGRIHTNGFDTLTSGDYTMLIMCKDIVGNRVSETSNFSIIIDNDAPKVTRAFKEGGRLKVITNEKAVCYYDYNKCNFDTIDADSMSIGFSRSHTVDWSPGTKYHIKCKDIWDNWDSRCSIIIKPEDI